MNKFTPGPWKTLAGDWDKDLDGYCRYTIQPLKELNASDANLIAAAPEMYEALRRLMDSAEDGRIIPEWLIEQLIEVKHALAKADGGQQ